ncbi:MAG: VIT1/CCC1 transporter family protein [Thermoplasmata archaeon]|nr:VIT1/CCC1 transporter family protein [Thermoplasmata archaeon]
MNASGEPNAAPSAASGPGAAGHEAHPRPTLLSDFILGSQDGIANVLGIILGLAAATSDVRIILIAALAALSAESVSMGAVAYTSTLSRRRLYLSERHREQREMQEVPETERAEIREVLTGWGYQGTALDEMLDRICANPRAMLEFMMSFELKLSPVEENAARNSAILVGTATVLGHFIPLIPFLFLSSNVLGAAIAAVILSAVTLFVIGWYEARTTLGKWYINGPQLMLIGLGGGLAGFLIGHVLGASGL